MNGWNKKMKLISITNICLDKMLMIRKSWGNKWSIHAQKGLANDNHPNCVSISMGRWCCCYCCSFFEEKITPVWVVSYGEDWL